jgi:hypothetical protein
MNIFNNRIVQSIKELADKAIEMQNKDRMDASLREISALCAMFDSNEEVHRKLLDAAMLERSTTGFAAVKLTVGEDGVVAGQLFTAEDMLLPAGTQITGDDAGAQPGDTVEITGTENTETGETTINSVVVAAPDDAQAAVVEETNAQHGDPVLDVDVDAGQEEGGVE